MIAKNGAALVLVKYYLINLINSLNIKFNLSATLSSCLIVSVLFYKL